MTRLWCITYEVLDGDPRNIYTIGVDMDYETAESLVLKDYIEKTNGHVYESEDLPTTINDIDVGCINWEAVPEEIDGWHVVLAEEVGSI